MKPPAAAVPPPPAIFRVFQPRTWDDDDFRALSAPDPSARELLLFLMLGPVTCAVPGLIHRERGGLTERLGWSLEEFNRCFGELEAHGWARADWTRHLVFLPRATADARPQSPNVVKAWLRAIGEMPACELRDDALRNLANALIRQGATGGFLAPFTEAFPEAFPKDFTEAFPEALTEGRSASVCRPSPNQKQKQNQNSEPEGFLRFYAAYPKKVGRKDAVKTWNKLAPSPELERTILEAIEAHKRSPAWAKDGGQFIPYPATFLNGERWTDDAKTALPARVNGQPSDQLFEERMAREGR